MAVAMAMRRETVSRNPGPAWGFAFLRAADRLMPRPIFHAGLAAGTWIAFFCMTRQRQCAAAYRRALAGREPSRVDLWRQFFAFIESFMELLRLGRDGRHRFELTRNENSAAFERLARSTRPALFGTFHVGNSDLLGYALSRFGRRIHMIRMRVENSDDTDWLGERFGNVVSFIWVDQPQAMLFALKEAIEAGHSIAIKCDRLEQSGRQEAFWFLGKRRLFPFTVYHLSLLFEMPVAFAVGWPAGPGRTKVTASSVFQPDRDVTRDENLSRARRHFQAVLRDLETKLKEEPSLWFNFCPLNPEAGHVPVRQRPVLARP